MTQDDMDTTTDDITEGNGTALHLIEKANNDKLDDIKIAVADDNCDPVKCVALFSHLTWLTTELYKSVSALRKAVKGLTSHRRRIVKLGPLELPVDFFNDPVRVLILGLLAYMAWRMGIVDDFAALAE